MALTFFSGLPMEVTALDISPTEAGETKTGNAGPEVGSAVYTRGDEAHAITKTYNLKTACASEQHDATANKSCTFRLIHL